MHHPTDRIAHTTAFVTPVVNHWLEPVFELSILRVMILIDHSQNIIRITETSNVGSTKNHYPIKMRCYPHLYCHLGYSEKETLVEILLEGRNYIEGILAIYIYTYLHTLIHIYIHKYIHTHTCMYVCMY